MKTSYDRSINRQKFAGTYDRNLEIRSLCANGHKQAELGRKFKVSRQRVFQIVNNPYDQPIESHQTVYNGQQGNRLSRRIVIYLKRIFARPSARRIFSSHFSFLKKQGR